MSRSDRNIIILLLGLLMYLVSCTATRHAKIAEKHAQKAELKQPGIITDKEIVDTIIFKKTIIDTIHTSDSTFYIERREVRFDSIVRYQYQQYDFTDMKTWFETWQSEKTNRVQIRNDRKIKKTDIKQNHRTNRAQIRAEKRRSWWWLWLIIGAGSMIVIKYAVKYGAGYLRLNK